MRPLDEPRRRIAGHEFDICGHLSRIPYAARPAKPLPDMAQTFEKYDVQASMLKRGTPASDHPPFTIPPSSFVDRVALHRTGM